MPAQFRIDHLVTARQATHRQSVRLRKVPDRWDWAEPGDWILELPEDRKGVASDEVFRMIAIPVNQEAKEAFFDEEQAAIERGLLNDGTRRRPDQHGSCE